MNDWIILVSFTPLILTIDVAPLQESTQDHLDLNDLQNFASWTTSNTQCTAASDTGSKDHTSMMEHNKEHNVKTKN